MIDMSTTMIFNKVLNTAVVNFKEIKQRNYLIIEKSITYIGVVYKN